MKKILYLVAMIAMIIAVPVLETGCKSAPSARITEVTTLKVLGASVDASMKIAVQLLADGRITVDQWQKIATVHDKFQNGYNIAVAAVQADLSSIASPDLISLANQIAGLVQSLQPATTP